MQIIKLRNQLTPISNQLKAEGAKIGFVPTMGALHQGHISLVEASKKRANITIVSIFVNPTQFNDPKDLEKYPRPIEQDIRMLEAAGCDILYLPEASDIYGPVTQVTDKFDLAGLDLELEGASRPGHFAGVAQVVKILLEITRPDILFLGQKDFQQCLILTQLINSLKMPVELVMCPIYREPHGLAMSSRNVRLNPQIRQKAGAIYASLQYAAAMVNILTPKEIQQAATAALNTIEGFNVDYFLLLNADNLKPITPETPAHRIVIITAVIVDGVRLLDNMVIS
ncbi:MAG TPA: pantoate--beta-alanine ligase [Chitinophagales bacterium]|nr:pantoate--beta-alanine ligase [Chitinophagales bacterium]